MSRSSTLTFLLSFDMCFKLTTLIVTRQNLDFTLPHLRIVRAFLFFFSSRRRHTRLVSDWSSDVCSSDLLRRQLAAPAFFFACLHPAVKRRAAACAALLRWVVRLHRGTIARRPGAGTSTVDRKSVV